MALRLRARIHARPRDPHDLRAVRLELLHHGCRHPLRHEHLARHARRRRIRRHRRARVPRRVERHALDAERRRHIHERRRPAILIGARRLEVLELQQHLDGPRLHRHERRHHMTDMHRMRHHILRILMQTEQPAAAAADRMRIQRILFLALLAIEKHRKDLPRGHIRKESVTITIYHPYSTRAEKNPPAKEEKPRSARNAPPCRPGNFPLPGNTTCCTIDMGEEQHLVCCRRQRYRGKKESVRLLSFLFAAKATRDVCPAPMQFLPHVIK